MNDPAKYGSLINYDTLLIRITQTGKFKVYEAQRIALFPHVSAALQLSKAGKSPMVGEGVEYIHTDAHHTNPLCRVKPKEFIVYGQALDCLWSLSTSGVEEHFNA